MSAWEGHLGPALLLHGFRETLGVNGPEGLDEGVATAGGDASDGLAHCVPL